MPETPSFAVVIPVYDEESGIRACVEAVDAVLAELERSAALVVVDDGSRDGTAAELAALELQHERLVVVRHERNRGYGAGLRSGTLAAAERGYDYVVFMDSDLTNDPRYLRDFVRLMDEGVDVIKASRYVSGGGVDGVPVWRASLSVVGNTVARLLFRLPVRDCTNGFRAIKTRLLTSVELSEPGFAVIMEELYRLRPLATSYAEVPITLSARTGEQRASSFSFGPHAMWRYLKYPLLSAFGRGRR